MPAQDDAAPAQPPTRLPLPVKTCRHGVPTAIFYRRRVAAVRQPCRAFAQRVSRVCGRLYWPGAHRSVREGTRHFSADGENLARRGADSGEQPGADRPAVCQAGRSQDDRPESAGRARRRWGSRRSFAGDQSRAVGCHGDRRRTTSQRPGRGEAVLPTPRSKAPRRAETRRGCWTAPSPDTAFSRPRQQPRLHQITPTARPATAPFPSSWNRPTLATLLRRRAWLGGSSGGNSSPVDHVDFLGGNPRSHAARRSPALSSGALVLARPSLTRLKFA